MKNFLILEGCDGKTKVYRSEPIHDGIISRMDSFDMTEYILHFSGIHGLFRYSRVKDFLESMFERAVEDAHMPLTKVRIGFLDEETRKCCYLVEVEKDGMNYKFIGKSGNDDGTYSTWRLV